MKCDKCNLPVEKKDSATWLSVMVGEMPAFGLFLCADRHIKCSPSRAQYIRGFDIVDKRPAYNKLEKDAGFVSMMEQKYTEAYEKLQRECLTIPA